MHNRKLGRTSSQRKAMLRSLTTSMIMNGKLVTTETRAKEVQSIVEKLVTLAVKEYKNTETVSVTKNRPNEKGEVEAVAVDVRKDKPSKLAARRAMLSYLYDVPAPRVADKNGKMENKKAYKDRTKDRKHPAVEVLFRDIAPKFDGSKHVGGYTRIVKLGQRRGDGAPTAILTFVED